MKSKSLLRHLFRHGPHNAKSKTRAPDDQAAFRNESLSQSQLQATSEAPEFLLAHRSILKSRDPFTPTRTLDENSDDVDNVSLAESIVTLDFDLDLSAFTKRDLVIAAIDEARYALKAHLDTINTTLALLGALEGFSATIETLSEEMVDKKRVCDGKLVMLEDVERGVRQMRFEEDGSMTDG